MRLRSVSVLVLIGLVGCAKPQRDALPGIQAQRQMQAFEVGLAIPGEATSGLHLIDRLNHHQVSTVSVAVVEDGELHWTRTWNASVDPESAAEDEPESPAQFRADALLPVLTSTLALRAVDQERLAFDDRLKAQVASGDEGLRRSVESAMGESFGAVLQQEILEPLEMDDTGLVGDGGLSTTSGDLAQWVIDLQMAHAGRPVRRLSRELAGQMILPTQGGFLGLETGGTGHSSWFASHGGGADSGASILGFVHSGQGAVVLAKGGGHAGLIAEVLAGLSKLYDWPTLPVVPAASSADDAEPLPTDAAPAESEAAPAEESSAS